MGTRRWERSDQAVARSVTYHTDSKLWSRSRRDLDHRFRASDRTESAGHTRRREQSDQAVARSATYHTDSKLWSRSRRDLDHRFRANHEHEMAHVAPLLLRERNKKITTFFVHLIQKFLKLA